MKLNEWNEMVNFLDNKIACLNSKIDKKDGKIDFYFSNGEKNYVVINIYDYKGNIFKSYNILIDSEFGMNIQKISNIVDQISLICGLSG